MKEVAEVVQTFVVVADVGQVRHVEALLELFAVVVSVEHCSSLDFAELG